MINFNLDFSKVDFVELFKKKRIYGSFILIIVGIIVGFYGKELNIIIDKKNLIDASINKEIVEEKLEEIRTRSKADYVAINLLIKDNKVLRRTYEAKRSDRVSLTNFVSDYPLLSFRNSFLVLKTKNWLYVLNSRDYKDDEYLAYVLNTVGCVSVLYIALHDEGQIEKDGKFKFIGFISYEFYKETELTPTQINNMILEKNLITPLLWSK